MDQQTEHNDGGLVTAIRAAQALDKDMQTIRCEVKLAHLGDDYLEYIARADDSEAVGRAVYQACLTFAGLVAFDAAADKLASLVRAKAVKLDEINTTAQAYIMRTTGADATPDFEVLSWTLQGNEAKAWAADKTAPTPTIDIIAEQRGVPFDLMRKKVLDKTLAYELLVANVIGRRQVLQGQLKAAKTLADVEKILVSYE